MAPISRRRLLAALSGGAAIEALHLGLGVGLGACGGSTTGALLELDASMRADVEAGAPFENSHGWTVTLSRIDVGLAALHVFKDESYAPEPEAALLRALSLAEAQAHAGHIEQAGVRGELVGAQVLELASGSRPLGVASGVSGPVGSGHVAFEPEALGGWGLWLEGRAERGSEQRLFRARASAADMMSHHGDPEVWGCPVDVATFDDDGRLQVIACPSLWLDDVDFGMQPALEERTDLDPLVGTHDAFVAGARDAQGWRFEYEPV